MVEIAGYATRMESAVLRNGHATKCSNIWKVPGRGGGKTTFFNRDEWDSPEREKVLCSWERSLIGSINQAESRRRNRSKTDK